MTAPDLGITTTNATPTSNSLQEVYRHYGVNLHVVDEADDAKRLQVCEELVRSFM